MNLSRLLLIGLLISPLLVMSQVKKHTYLACKIEGYKGPKVFIDSSRPDLSKEFTSVEGQLYELSFETSESLAFMINSALEVFLQPGDSLVVSMGYGERRYEDVDFSGTDNAMLQNELIQDMISAKRALRYKDNLLACIVVETLPVDRHVDSKKLLARANSIIEAGKGTLSTDFAEYFLAGAEAAYMGSMIKYPVMYNDMKKMPFDQMGIGNFWDIDKGFKLRESKSALMNPNYSGFLMDYMIYTKSKAAQSKGTKYVEPRDLNGMFEALSTTYTGPSRDAVLYALLNSYIRNGKNIEKAEPLIKRYQKEFNENKTYIAELNKMMQ